MVIEKVVDFYSDIKDGSQFISFHMHCDTLSSLIEECESIKQYLNTNAKNIKGQLGDTWDYKIGFYEARHGVVTVGAI
jgi:hypothetical protein